MALHPTRGTLINVRFSDGRPALAARPVVCGPNRQALHRMLARVWTQDHTMRLGKLETDVLHLALGEPLPTTARGHATPQVSAGPATAGAVCMHGAFACMVTFVVLIVLCMPACLQPRSACPMCSTGAAGRMTWLHCSRHDMHWYPYMLSPLCGFSHGV